MKLLFLFAVCISRFLGVLHWLFSDCWFFFQKQYGHIWCVLWPLLSVNAASEIKGLRFNNELHEITLALRMYCTEGRKVLCSGGRCGTSQHCQEHGLMRPGTLWPLMQQWQGKCALSSGLHGDKVYLAWNGRGLSSVHLHLPLATSLHLVQLLAHPCEQLLLYPGSFKAQDCDFQSNHVKSYCLLLFL